MTAPTRMQQVIRLLGRHKALSIGAMHALMQPPITEKRLRKVIEPLYKNGHLNRRLVRHSSGSVSYYELADSTRLGEKADKVHNFLLDHNDQCAFVKELLFREYPEAICSHESDIPKSADLRGIMMHDKGERDTLPDIMMALPSLAGDRPVYLAIEVERSIKSSKRILKKFDKYASKSHLDGVLYLSEDERVLATLRRRYLEKIADRAKRISHYKNHFFLTARAPRRRNLKFENPQNACGEAVQLAHWLRGLASVPLPLRRDGVAAHWGGGSPGNAEQACQPIF